MRENVSKLIPFIRVPKLPELSFSDKLALMAGTGLGIGFFRPFPATWGSIPGFFYFVFLTRLGSIPVAVIVELAMLLLCVWSSNRCEILFRQKDPKAVVIDEIVCVPFALWPIWRVQQLSWQWWIALFVFYRLFDVLKPFPARKLESLPGGVGVLIDDLISSVYMGVLLYHGRWLV